MAAEGNQAVNREKTSIGWIEKNWVPRLQQSCHECGMEMGGGMRTLHYVLGGKTGNSDDCIDLAHKTMPTGVEIKAVVREIASESYVCKYLSCELLWRFPGHDICYEETFGGCFSHESGQRQMRSVDNANLRLSNLINRLCELNIPVRVAEKVLIKYLPKKGGKVGVSSLTGMRELLPAPVLFRPKNRKPGWAGGLESIVEGAI